jgi:hypothetical protein
MGYGRSAADTLDRGSDRCSVGCAMILRKIRIAPALGLLAVAAIVGVSGAVVAQESLLPPGFDDKPAPSPTPTRRNTPAPTAAPPRKLPIAPIQEDTSASVSSPIVQAVPGTPSIARAPEPGTTSRDPLDSIDPAFLDQIVANARPRYDTPPQSQRSLAKVGFLDEQDGGFPSVSSHYLNGRFVGGLLKATRGPLVSRWGHILLRRALASRLDTPVGLNGADWAALRAGVMLRLGEADAARAMVQEVDSGLYTRSLEDAAMGSFLATADPVGLCPITALTAAGRAGWDWDLSRSICTAFTNGEGASAQAQLDRAMRKGTASRIDILLAQKFAGAASSGRRAVTIEWSAVDMLTPWRTGLALATGIQPPEALRAKAGRSYAFYAVRAPMLPLAARAQAADVAAARGVLSASAMVDLYSQIAALDQPDATWGPLAEQLRTAYVAPAASARLAAIKGLWGDSSDPVRAYSRLVLTAYAAARVAPDAKLVSEAPGLLAAMLSAGLDQNAMRWAPFVSAGGDAWGLLALAAPAKLATISGDNLTRFQASDTSSEKLRSRFLLAGLMGLGRVDQGTARSFATTLQLDMARETRWTRAIDAAADSENPVLVAMLAGFGMQGSGWDKMTALHLYHIVSALRRVGLDGEARMIAAEAVARV